MYKLFHGSSAIGFYSWYSQVFLPSGRTIRAYGPTHVQLYESAAVRTREIPSCERADEERTTRSDSGIVASQPAAKKSAGQPAACSSKI